MTPLLDAREIAISGRLEPTHLGLEQSQLVAVIGPNGAGKTSLLRALAGIEFDAGRVLISGEDIAQAAPARRMRLVAYLPATRSLIWPIAARDVIALGLPAFDPGRIEDLIEMLELGRLADRPVNHLSTGERSRVLLARALAAKPRLLLLDEPLSNLDPYWVLRTLEILQAETRTSGSAMLASVHDLEQVSAFDRVILVSDGRVIADSKPREMLDSSALSQAFRIERSGSGWRVRQRA